MSARDAAVSNSPSDFYKNDEDENGVQLIKTQG